jgi:hypothetical protein
MKTKITILTAMVLALSTPLGFTQVPQIINYQGKINVGATPFTGNGQFKFALVNGDGSTSFWSHDGTSTAGSEPSAAVTLPVANGLYVVPLGDTAIPNMQAVPATVFTNSDVRLRVWFNDGTNGSQLLAPDQRITSVGYAMVAGTVPDGAIGSAQLAPSFSVTGTVAAGSFAGSGAALTGINTGSVFVRWGNATAPTGTTLLYSGIAFGGSSAYPGAGGPFVLAGGDPGASNPGGANSSLQPIATGTPNGPAMPAGITQNCILKGAVCHAPGPVTTIWGTWTVPTGWTLLYKGYAMGSFYNVSSHAPAIVVDADSFDATMTRLSIGSPETGFVFPCHTWVSGGSLTTNYPSYRWVKAAVIMKSPNPGP